MPPLAAEVFHPMSSGGSLSLLCTIGQQNDFQKSPQLVLQLQRVCPALMADIEVDVRGDAWGHIHARRMVDDSYAQP